MRTILNNVVRYPALTLEYTFCHLNLFLLQGAPLSAAANYLTFLIDHIFTLQQVDYTASSRQYFCRERFDQCSQISYSPGGEIKISREQK